ncbi:MAG: hypothetical protein NTY66_00350, partial [Candidatus Vogelbacteria bacterium]|nr:hypothetical protein [Candidatus Vogelbacteria bacterium]
EEPPRHVIFILATTEAHKLPDTIISRCQTFVFKKPGVEILKKYVLQTAKKEGFVIDEPSANLVAMLGEGSFRDTLGILQKVIGLSADKRVSREEIEAITGAPKEQHVYDLLAALLAKKSDLALNVIQKLCGEGRDPRVFIKMALVTIRQAMILRYAPEQAANIKSETGDSGFLRLEEAARHENGDRLPAILKEFLSVYDEMDQAYLPQLPLEIATVKICLQ